MASTMMSWLHSTTIMDGINTDAAHADILIWWTAWPPKKPTHIGLITVHLSTSWFAYFGLFKYFLIYIYYSLSSEDGVFSFIFCFRQIPSHFITLPKKIAHGA